MRVAALQNSGASFDNGLPGGRGDFANRFTGGFHAVGGNAGRLLTRVGHRTADGRRAFARLIQSIRSHRSDRRYAGTSLLRYARGRRTHGVNRTRRRGTDCGGTIADCGSCRSNCLRGGCSGVIHNGGFRLTGRRHAIGGVSQH